MANYGIRVSRAGSDVLTDPDSGMVFTSKYAPLRIAWVGTAAIPFAASAANASYLINTGVMTSAQTHSFAFLDVGNGKMIRSNVADFVGSNSDGINCFPTTTYSFDPVSGLFSSFIKIDLLRETWSSTWPAATTVTVKMYLLI